MLKESLDMVEDEGVVYVLILILMEHAQRGYAGEPLLPLQVSVLILILMEHAQREKRLLRKGLS